MGKVTDVRGWDSESGRSVAAVTWSSGSTNVYRVGHKGKVDLKYIQAAAGGYYYRDHLPVLGKLEDTFIYIFLKAAVLHIKRGNKDNVGIISSISS